MVLSFVRVQAHCAAGDEFCGSYRRRIAARTPAWNEVCTGPPQEPRASLPNYVSPGGVNDPLPCLADLRYIDARLPASEHRHCAESGSTTSRVSYRPGSVSRALRATTGNEFLWVTKMGNWQLPSRLLLVPVRGSQNDHPAYSRTAIRRRSPRHQPDDNRISPIIARL